MGRSLVVLGVPNVLGGAAWTPASIDGLALWLDASDSTTLFQDAAGTTPAASDNDVVGLWQDKSGNARHASQATTGLKPLLKLNHFGSLPAVKADGADDLLEFTQFSTGAAWTLYVVAAANTINNTVEYFFATATAGFYWGGTFANMSGFGIYNGSAFFEAVGEPTALLIYTFQNAQLFLNGAEVTYGVGKTGPVGAMLINRIFQREPLNLKSDASIGELILYSATHDAATRAQVWAYLNDKWTVY